MTVSNKTLGIIAMIGAPFLFLEMLSDYKFGLAGTAAAGICDLIYMMGWIGSITGPINWKQRVLKTGRKIYFV